jgi:hypothetical protein
MDLRTGLWRSGCRHRKVRYLTQRIEVHTAVVVIAMFAGRADIRELD